MALGSRGEAVDHALRRYLQEIGSHELLTMAIQNLYGDPLRLARQDPEMFEWTVDLLRRRLS